MIHKRLKRLTEGWEIFLLGAVFTLFIFSNVFAEEKEVDIKKLSESLGHIIGKNLDDLGFKLDLKNMLKGIKKGSQKKLSPMSEDECLEALAQIQIKENEKITSQNLKDARDFLINNLKDKDVIELGNARWNVAHTPGHLLGSVSLIDQENQLVVSGDVLFHGSIGRTDLWQGSLPVLMQSIYEKLMPLDDDFLVLCGHGPDTTIGFERANNPFLQT